MFVRNCWYPVAWSPDVGRELLERWVCGVPIVLYRTEAGDPVALHNRCVHRRAPLSKGQLIGDVVQCGYHGMEFDCHGRCVKVPGQEVIPEGAAVASYPVVDRWRFLWLWMGEPAAADPTTIPDMHWNDSPGWVSPGDTLTVACEYRLMLDNLLDLSHLTYLHGRTIGNPHVAETPMRVKVDGDRVRVTRWILDKPAPPMFERVRHFETTVDRWQIIEWTPPGNVVIDVGCAPTGTGAPEGDRSQGIEARSINLVTPMTERQSLYLWSYARNYALEDESVTRMLYENVAMTFLEDKEMLEAQQHLIDTDSEGGATIDIRVDAGPLQVRRILERLMAGESGGVSAAAE